jgi:hypothetical protein
MLKKLLLAAALSLLSSASFAACTNPLSIKDGTLGTILMSMSSNGDGFCQYNFNMAQVGGTATATGSGATSAGTQRFVLATDSPGIVTLGPATVANSLPNVLSSQYPVNATTTTPTAITGNSTGTTGAVVGTLSGVASVTTFICGFNVSATGGTAAIGPITVAGLVGSSMVFQFFSTATGANLTQTFNPCIPASAVNTAITVTTTADGTATAVDVNSWGYRL